MMRKTTNQYDVHQHDRNEKLHFDAVGGQNNQNKWSFDGLLVKQCVTQTNFGALFLYHKIMES